MARRSFNVLAFCLCLASGLQVGVASAVGLLGETSATLEWTPASGPVVEYGVYVALNGQPFTDEPETMVAGLAR